MNKKELYYEFDEKILFEHLHLFYINYDYENRRFSDKKDLMIGKKDLKFLKRNI